MEWKFKVEVLDVWEITITAVEGEFVTKKKARYHFVDEQGRSMPLPGKAGIAVRVQRVGGKGGGAGNDQGCRGVLSVFWRRARPPRKSSANETWLLASNRLN